VLGGLRFGARVEEIDGKLHHKTHTHTHKQGKRTMSDRGARHARKKHQAPRRTGMAAVRQEAAAQQKKESAAAHEVKGPSRAKAKKRGPKRIIREKINGGNSDF
jgi:hypothetical protein